MPIAWPLTDGRITLRPASIDDAPAILAYQRRAETQRYLSRTLDTLAQTEELIRERLQDPAALPSLRVLTKAGFHVEGTERAAVLGRDGRWLDNCTLSHVDG